MQEILTKFLKSAVNSFVNTENFKNAVPKSGSSLQTQLPPNFSSACVYCSSFSTWASKRAKHENTVSRQQVITITPKLKKMAEKNNLSERFSLRLFTQYNNKKLHFNSYGGSIKYLTNFALCASIQTLHKCVQVSLQQDNNLTKILFTKICNISVTYKGSRNS